MIIVSQNTLFNDGSNQNQDASLSPGIAPSRILVMGPSACSMAAALVRMKGSAEIHHAETAAEAIELLKNYSFDHVLIDNRNDGSMTLTIPRLASLKTVSNIVVLAGPLSAESISMVHGVSAVLTPPYNAMEIASRLGIEVTDNRRSNPENQEYVPGRRAEDQIDNSNTADDTAELAAKNEYVPEKLNLRRILIALGNVIPGLTPLLSMLYKNVALTILGALFVAFVSYGIMIAFFLTSGDWSSPLQLQPGHELVAKAERERNELRVKRNLVTQQLADVETMTSRATSALLRSASLEQMTMGTIEQEIINRKQRKTTLADQIETLEAVLVGFSDTQTRKLDRKKLENDFNRRVISRNTYQAAMLSYAQIEQDVANIGEKISTKRSELENSNDEIAYLESLLADNKGDLIGSKIRGIAAFVPLNNQIIEVRQTKANAESDIRAAADSKPALENSLHILDAGLISLEKTPMIRATETPINVLFVPYDNLTAYGENQPLYSCALALFWCSKVGTTGAPIGGEITTTHPFFGKPLRGQFVEANLTDQSAAKKEILHVGRPPFFF